MSYHDVIEVCRTELFTAGADIVALFGEAAAERVMRIRDMYMWRLSNPDAPICIGMDYNANINWIVAGQPRGRQLNVIKSFYV